MRRLARFELPTRPMRDPETLPKILERSPVAVKTPETMEMPTSVISVLAKARERCLIGVPAGKSPFSDREALYISQVCFGPVAREWLPRAARQDGIGRTELTDRKDGNVTVFSQITALLSDTRVQTSVGYCWDWFLTETSSGLSPWIRFLAAAEDRDEADQEKSIKTQIYSGADRYLAKIWLRGTPALTLRRGIQASLLNLKRAGKLVKTEDLDLCMEAYHLPRHEYSGPQPKLNLKTLAARIGPRDPSGARHRVTHAVLPSGGKRNEFILDACDESKCPLTERQFVELAILVFRLDLRELQRVEIEPAPKDDDGSEHTASHAGIDANTLAPDFWKERAYDWEQHKSFAEYKAFANRVVRAVEREDGVPISAPVNDPRRSGSGGRPLPVLRRG